MDVSPTAVIPPRQIPPASSLLATSPDLNGSVGSVFDDITSMDTDLPENKLVESVYSPSDYDADDEDFEAEVSTLSNDWLADNENDNTNAVEIGDTTGQFGVIESEDEAEKDDVATGEFTSEGDTDGQCVPKDSVDNPEETEVEIAAEVLFAENALERFGGEDAVMAGCLKNDVLRSMSVSGWGDVEEPDTHEHLMSPYEPVNDSKSYSGLHQGYFRPTAEALRHSDSPTAFFIYLLPVAVWQHIAACSN
ncbi:hypothetical protein P3T76_005536 [Phytophthora citrophthora]|uniref:Uncharacterized protein n=1 Tax=Phytophthora citrophthora TaxID=4793 RepID=A0AAD9GQ14_9STRA|nr:hypothetical protein P3T76_005536 [Phytophthora citrophthora]